MVDPDSEWKLGAFVYESLNGDRHQMERKVFDNYRRSSLSDVHCPGVTSGDIYQSVRFTAKPRDATKNSACRSKYACITT